MCISAHYRLIDAVYMGFMRVLQALYQRRAAYSAALALLRDKIPALTSDKSRMSSVVSLRLDISSARSQAAAVKAFVVPSDRFKIATDVTLEPFLKRRARSTSYLTRP